MPLKPSGILFSDKECFSNGLVGFEEVKPINVLIGKNNSGKSRLLKLLRDVHARRASHKFDSFAVLDLTAQEIADMGISLYRSPPHEPDRLKLTYKFDTNHYRAIEFVGASAKTFWRTSTDHMGISIKNSVIGHVFAGHAFKHLDADRDITPEPWSNSPSLSANGQGATSLIANTLHSVAANRDLISKTMLKALQEVFSEDGNFTEIASRHHGATGSEREIGDWEIYLYEEKKGLISLSTSGSGLKTIILTLLNLLVLPTQGASDQKYVFIFEELENNLHPALFRRLLRFIEKTALERGYTIFLTTHSSIALDYFSEAGHAQIIQVSHDGTSASTQNITTYTGKMKLLAALGAKPSDLLQSNGIIWVEGPSDRIYVNKWVELASNGKFQEGRDYQCVAYGGSLLARKQFVDPEQADSELINLLNVNPNFYLVCDSDKTDEDAALKARVTRIKEEAQKIGGCVWVTACKEIENYLPGSVLTAYSKSESVLPDPKQYEYFFPAAGGSNSYMQKKLKRSSYDKIELASTCSAKLSYDDMKGRFDWEEQVRALLHAIRRWNS